MPGAGEVMEQDHGLRGVNPADITVWVVNYSGSKKCFVIEDYDVDYPDEFLGRCVKRAVAALSPQPRTRTKENKNV